MASAAPTTMTEALQKVIQDISGAMTTPDADIPFLTQLQGVIVGRMRAGSGAGGGQMQQRPGMGMPGQQQGMPGGGMQPAMAGGAPPPPGQPPQPGGPGQMQGSPTPNGVTPLAQLPSTDELRRQIAGSAGA